MFKITQKEHTMKLEKKEAKTKPISSKITDEQNEKLTALAEKEGITKSSLISQLLGIGYMAYTKRKTF